MKINPRGYWENETSEGHGTDPLFIKAFADFCKDREYATVLDIGCGDGYYTKYLLDQGIYCEGYDGNPFTEKITGGLCKVADFSQYQNLGYFDCVLSIEVGEHIPSIYEQVFLYNVIDHAKKCVVISWAVPGQDGNGHVNCKTNSEVKNWFYLHGFFNDLKAEIRLRNSVSPYPQTAYWLSNTLMVFCRK